MNNTLFIGMDLGSFKTSVVSSNGTQEVIYSAVGWPKDSVARSVLGQDVIVGKDVLEKRLALDVVRPFEKGSLKFSTGNGGGESGNATQQASKQLEAARLLVRHVVGLTRPPKDSTILGVIGAPARASVANKQTIIDVSRESLHAVMVVSEPFAVAYSVNRLTDALVVDIGAGTTDICRLSGTFPADEDQFTVPIGGDRIDEEFCRLIKAEYPDARLTTNMARQIKERYGCVADERDKVAVQFPANGRPRTFDVTRQLYDACRIIVPPIMQGIQQLVATCDPEFQAQMLGNVLLAGGGSQIKGLDKVIEDGLAEFGGGRVTKVHDPVFAGSVGALKLAMAMPKEYWDQLTQLTRDASGVSMKPATRAAA